MDDGAETREEYRRLIAAKLKEVLTPELDAEWRRLNNKSVATREEYERAMDELRQEWEASICEKAFREYAAYDRQMREEFKEKYGEDL